MDKVYILFKNSNDVRRRYLGAYEDEGMVKADCARLNSDRTSDERYYYEVHLLVLRTQTVIRPRYTPPSKVIFFYYSDACVGVQFVYPSHMFSITVHYNSAAQAVSVLFPALGVVRNTIIISNALSIEQQGIVLDAIRSCYE